MASFTIAFTGKGGVGKTTLAALCVARLIARGHTPLLAVDADPNRCLDLALGVSAVQTIGGVREDARRLAQARAQAGMSTQELLERKIAESLVEERHFDLLAMGRPEGPGCYCYANNVLGQALRHLAGQYACVVIDNEAGLENLSRRIVTDVSLLVVVSDPSHQGRETVRRLIALAHEMDVRYEKLALLVNRTRGPALPRAFNEIPAAPDIVLTVPEDIELSRRAEEGADLRDLPEDSSAVRALDTFLTRADITTTERT